MSREYMAMQYPYFKKDTNGNVYMIQSYSSSIMCEISNINGYHYKITNFCTRKKVLDILRMTGTKITAQEFIKVMTDKFNFYVTNIGLMQSLQLENNKMSINLLEENK